MNCLIVISHGSGCEFPTCMVSPTAVPKLISYIHIL